MKKYTTLGAALIMTMSMACSNAVYDSQPSKKSGTKDTSLAYMDHLYNKESAAALKAKFLTGPIYEKNPEAMKRMLNLYLRFPMQNIGTSGGTVTPSMRANMTSKSIADIDWTDSLPPDFLDWCREKSIDLTSDILSETMIKFLDSPEGQAFINTYLDDVQKRMEEMIDYGIDEFADEYETEMNIALATGGFIAISEGVMAGAAVYAAISTGLTMTMNPLSSVMTAASMMQSYVQHQEMMAKLEQISQQLEQIQASLDRIETKLDTLMGYTVDIAVQLKYEDAKKARAMLKVIERQLVFMKDINDPKTIENMKWFISPNNFEATGYQMMMENAFNSACDTQDWLVTNNLIRNSNFDNYVYRECINAITLNYVYRDIIIKAPSYFIQSDKNTHAAGINLSDVEFLIKLSKTRLQLVELLYSGDESLRLRKTFAKNDIDNYFSRINISIENSNTKPAQFISDYIQELITEHSGTNLHTFSKFLSFEDKVNFTQFKFFTPLFLITNVKTTSTDAIISITDFEKYKNAVSDYLISEYEISYQRNHLLQMKTLNTAWMMTLQAHIDAGAGL